MSEEYIIKHCSPTLAGIKTGNLFSCEYTSVQDVYDAADYFNRVFIPKGVKMTPLKFGKTRVLVYVYRISKLKLDLASQEAGCILCSQGYKSQNPEYCLSRLRQRINSVSDFPHEIGLFLGYPPEDVSGFILHKGNCCKLCGCWKVYGNEEKAERQFAKFKKCSDIYYSKWAQGTPLKKLTVAAR